MFSNFKEMNLEKDFSSKLTDFRFNTEPETIDSNRGLEYLSLKIMDLQNILETNKIKEINRLNKLYQEKVIDQKDLENLEKKFKFLFGKTEGKRIFESSFKVFFYFGF